MPPYEKEGAMKATLYGELLLLVGLLAVAYLLYVQQEQLVTVELELDRLRGAFAPVPAASENDAAPRPRTKRKVSDA
jgi:hypothetical protein